MTVERWATAADLSAGVNATAKRRAWVVLIAAEYKQLGARSSDRTARKDEMLARGLTYPRRIATRRVGFLDCEAAAVNRPDSTRRARRIKRLLPSALWARSSVDLTRDRMPHTNDPERGQQYQQGACGAGDHFSCNTAEQTRCLQPELRPGRASSHPKP